MDHLEKINKLAFNVWFDKRHYDYPESPLTSVVEYQQWKQGLFEAYCAGIEFERVVAKAGM